MYLWRLFRAFFFSAELLLSPAPADLSTSWQTLTAPKPVVVLNESAQLRVDVSHVVPPSTDFMAVFAAGEAAFPKGCVQARLTTRSAATAMLGSDGVSVGKDSVELILSALDNLPMEVEFTQVEIRADCPIVGARIRWLNARH